jgi:hypothetical protein
VTSSTLIFESLEGADSFRIHELLSTRWHTGLDEKHLSELGEQLPYIFDHSLDVIPGNSRGMGRKIPIRGIGVGPKS